MNMSNHNTISNGDPDDEGLPVRRHYPGSRGSQIIDDHLARVAIRMMEMEQGLRPASTLDAQASPLAARRIRRHLYTAMNAKKRRGIRRTAPISLIRVRSFHPSAGVVEGVIVLRSDGRVRAYSMRLEEERGHWWIVELSPPESDLRPAITTASRTGAVPIGPDGRRRSSGRMDDDGSDEAAAEDRGWTDDGPEQHGPQARGPDVR